MSKKAPKELHSSKNAGLISLDSLALVTAQLPTSKRRHPITIVSCDPTPAREITPVKALISDRAGVA